MMHKQSTEEEYDFEFLIAKRDLATNGSVSHTLSVEGGEYKEGGDDIQINDFVTKESIFKDSRKTSQRIRPKFYPKPSNI